MTKPLLPIHSGTTSRDLLRLFNKGEVIWTQHFAQETELAVGLAFTNPDLNEVHDANRVLQAALPEGMTPEQAYDEVQQHYATQGVSCRKWMMSVSANESQTEPLIAMLIGKGYTAQSCDAMYLQSIQPTGAAREEGITIIPARASYRHMQQITEEAANERWKTPQLAEAGMMHLDDPHWDALIALQNGKAVARAGVLGYGEIGLIEQVYVSASVRRQGLGLLIMQRILEICMRSQFKHVMLGVAQDNAPAIALYQRLGFKKIGEMTEYHAPIAP